VIYGNKDELLVYGDQFTTPDDSGIRDYIHVEDLASAHVGKIKSELGWIAKYDHSDLTYQSCLDWYRKII